jgi:hypothetical protein
MKGLQAAAAGTLDDQHTEGDTIDQTIAAARENRPDLTTFRIANALILRKMEVGARNTKFDQIVEALHKSTVIEHVVLSNIGGNDHLASKIAVMLSSNTSVRTLSLESNDIRGPGVDALAESLHNNSTLEKLKLADLAKRLPSQSLHKLAHAVEQSRLTTCSVCCHDATARERLEKALLRNMDKVRQARKAARSCSGTCTEGSQLDHVGLDPVSVAIGKLEHADPLPKAHTAPLSLPDPLLKSQGVGPAGNETQSVMLQHDNEAAYRKRKGEIEYLQRKHEIERLKHEMREMQTRLARLCHQQELAELEGATDDHTG